MGFGNIGSGVIQALRDNKDLLEARCPRPLELRRVADVDLKRPRPVEVDHDLLTDDSQSVIHDREIDVVIELIGGIEPARTLVEGALNAGKHVVTANKAMLAHHGAELLALAAQKRVRLLFEAAVGGGVPVIRALTECLAANRITRIEGILNGTCNFILGEMCGVGSSFEKAVAEAQKQGYAEPDPTADIESIDAANKIAILASLAFGCDIRYEDVYREGITKITPEDTHWVWEDQYVIKQYALAEIDPDGAISVSVRPALVHWIAHPFSHVPFERNAVTITGEPIGTVLLYGRGAGPKPTASAVLGDLMWLSQFEGGQAPPPPFLTIPVGRKPLSKNTAPGYNGYYLRILSRRLDMDFVSPVSKILTRCGVRIAKIGQIWHGQNMLTRVFTSGGWEGDIRRAVSEIQVAGLSELQSGVLCLPLVWACS
jgi:homoserine dehydrogenase